MNDAAQQNDDGTRDGEDGSVSRRSVLWTTATVAGAGIGLGGLGSSTAAAAIPGRSPETAAAAQPDQAAAPKRQGRTMVGVPFDRRSTVRVGLVGLGNRGGSMIDLFLAVGGVQVVAVCDPVKAKAERAAAKVTAAGQPPPSTPMARTTTRTSASAGTSTSSMWRRPGTSTSRWRRPPC